MKILMVDDERNVLDALGRQLRNKFNLDTATNGVVGLEKLKTDGPYTVVIADMQMPIMDGYQFFEELQRRGGKTAHDPSGDEQPNRHPRKRTRRTII